MTQSVAKLLGIAESRRTYSDSPRLALAKCLVGVEFEAENVKEHLPKEGFSDCWREERDGSLRGASMEYVLEAPLFGQDLLDAVTWLCDWAKTKKLESNYRTGLHVHIDSRNLELNQLVTMILYYTLFEKAIFRWVGDDREGSVFCLPFYKADGVIGTIAAALANKEQMRQVLPGERERYAAFNLNALVKYGSVEWRHLQTTWDTERIFKWINLALSFKKYAKNNPTEPWELLRKLSELGPRKVFADIVGEELAYEFFYHEFEADVWKIGLPCAQDMALQLDDKTRKSWDTLRNTLTMGKNVGFSKWIEKKGGTKGFERPHDIFSDPELLRSPQLQQEAANYIYNLLRRKMDEAGINVAAMNPAAPPPPPAPAPR